MRAFAGVVAVLLVSSGASFGQTAAVQSATPVQQTAPVQATDQVQQAATAQATDQAQQTAPAQPTDQAQQTAPAQPTDQAQQTAPVQPTDQAQQTAPVQATDQVQSTAPVQPIVAEASKPEAAGPGGGLTTGLAAGLAADPASPASPASAATAESAPSADPVAPSADAVPAVRAVSFGPGAKLYLEPMDGFGELLAEAITKKKVPVVLVHDRADADFILTGDAHVKTPGWLKGNFVYLHGKANISIDDAHTGETVFAYTATRVDANLVDGEVYSIWAGGCANHLKKALKKK